MPTDFQEQEAAPQISHPQLRRCLSIDLEIAPPQNKLLAIAACRPDTGDSVHFTAPNADRLASLARIDNLARDADFLLGHNIIAFDLPHLRGLNGGLELLAIPPVDTLRLNPLAYPRNPYHHLVKHYQDGGLVRRQANNPLLDSFLTVQVFNNQLERFRRLRDTDPNLLTAWHWLATNASDVNPQGFNQVFSAVRETGRPNGQCAGEAIGSLIKGHGCDRQVARVLDDLEGHNWSLAYALAWLSVAGTDSVTPPWVLHQFPETGRIIRALRDTPCQDRTCSWCIERHDATKELGRWFGFTEFRPEPADADGNSLQKSIVEKAMQGDHLLAILPTGAGKSVCYQVPALSRYDKTGALTVVISPLVALMADQIANLEQRGIGSAVTINGLLSMPERREALERIRLGQASLVLVSPEQLRSRSLRGALDLRQVGSWVLDEAHCLSKWGHDFRPDYRYIGRYIAQRPEAQSENRAGGAAPILCLTATAKPDVKQEIIDYFDDTLGIDIQVLDGGTQRDNLDFVVVQTTTGQKLGHIQQILENDLHSDLVGGAIIYCSTRRHAEEISNFLKTTGVSADHFHAGLSPEKKRQVQEDFIEGRLRAISATNAFGMGIDKPDVRLVIHADVPGSLENYLQEAGRAGRDNDAARCVLLYTEEDIERQFGMTASSRLTQADINAVLKSLRKLGGRKGAQQPGGASGSTGDRTIEVIATAGEILSADEEQDFQRDTVTDDTRVRSAVGWLEEASILSRHDNDVRVFASSLTVSSMEETRRHLDREDLTAPERQQLQDIVRRMINAPPDQGISTDELADFVGMSHSQVHTALERLKHLRIARNDTVITAYVNQGNRDNSRNRLQHAALLEEGLIQLMQEAAPDQQVGETQPLHLRHATQVLRDRGNRDVLPELVQRTLKSMAADQGEEGDSTASIRVRATGNEISQITLMRDWRSVEQSARRRRRAAEQALDHLLARLPANARGADLLVETTMGNLGDALGNTLENGGDRNGQGPAAVANGSRLLHQALIWLHDQQVIRLNKGLSVFRPAMTIHLREGRNRFLQSDFEPLRLHYDEQVLQIHIMTEYARQGLNSTADALHLTLDYFSLPREQFIDKWLSSRKQELARQMSRESWTSIVDGLRNPAQRGIVADDRTRTNVLVLAGPGSGKTRVLVHRIAYLIRGKRENPRSIIALAYNRHAAVQIRQRLRDLIGDDANGVLAMTCHGLAMRLTGATFSSSIDNSDENAQKLFDDILIQATDLLNGRAGVTPEDADDQRDRLLAGFRWILVDEYQDIKEHEYNLISALAGRTRADLDQKLNLFAVGDDDQNIYAWSGSSTKYIRQFREDYRAEPLYLVQNYRSTRNIIEAANTVIDQASDRLKEDHPITINDARSRQAPGGPWATIDPVTQGRVQVLPAGDSSLVQAQAALQELGRPAALDPEWDWSTCAVIARNWALLDPVRALCQIQGIPVQMGREDFTATWQLRETQELLGSTERGPEPVRATAILERLEEQPSTAWTLLLAEAVDLYRRETGDLELPAASFREWLAEWARDNRRRQSGLLLTTAHGAKGLEFNHVVVLDGGWDRAGRGEDRDAPRRLYYVAMTRAVQSLTLCETRSETARANPFTRMLSGEPAVLTRPAPAHLPAVPPELQDTYHRLSLRDVQLSLAGYRDPDHPIHQAIARLKAGDPLRVNTGAEPWELWNTEGTLVGRLSSSCPIQHNPDAASGNSAGHRAGGGHLDQGKVRNPVPGAAEGQFVGGGHS